MEKELFMLVVLLCFDLCRSNSFHASIWFSLSISNVFANKNKLKENSFPGGITSCTRHKDYKYIILQII